MAEIFRGFPSFNTRGMGENVCRKRRRATNRGEVVDGHGGGRVRRARHSAVFVADCVVGSV